MKNLFITLVAVLLLVACGKNAKGVVEAYYSNLDKGEITEASKLMSKRVSAMGGEEKVRAMLLQQAKRMQAKGGVASLVAEGEAKGEMGEFIVHIVYKDGTKADDKASVTKEEEGWKISP